MRPTIAHIHTYGHGVSPTFITLKHWGSPAEVALRFTRKHSPTFLTVYATPKRRRTPIRPIVRGPSACHRPYKHPPEHQPKPPRRCVVVVASSVRRWLVASSRPAQEQAHLGSRSVRAHLPRLLLHRLGVLPPVGAVAPSLGCVPRNRWLCSTSGLCFLGVVAPPWGCAAVGCCRAELGRFPGIGGFAPPLGLSFLRQRSCHPEGCAVFCEHGLCCCCVADGGLFDSPGAALRLGVGCPSAMARETFPQ